MTTQLYVVPIPAAQTHRQPEGGASSNVEQTGIVTQAGIATERIASENVDLTIRGQFGFAEFSKKLARELESLAESSYTSVPLADDAAPDEDDQSGYYELSNVEVNRAHETTTLAHTYRLELQHKGTRENHWRAVSPTEQDISTSLATGTGGLVGIPAEASKVRWFETSQGSEVASVDSTVSAEYGDVDLFDPSGASFDDPTLLYEVSFDREGPVDVRVWDDVGKTSKFASYDDADGTTHDITQWVHAFHPSFEFEGVPIVDNGLLRLRFDETNGQIDADEWDDANSVWADLSTAGGSTADYELFDADLERYGPAEVRVFAEWEDTSAGTIHATVIEVQRGIDRAVVREPDGTTIPSNLESMLSPIASTQSTDQNPSQTVESRGEVK